jgi:glycosyltransferase involved in cell wall biosynthesis
VASNRAGLSILIDISAAVNQGAGIGRYARELTRQLLPRLATTDVGLWYATTYPTHDEAMLCRPPWSGVSNSRSPLSRRNVDRIAIRRRLPIAWLLQCQHATDVYSPDFTAPPVGKARSHITVHDLAWFHPEAVTPKPLADFLGPVVDRAVRHAATVFTVSDTIRNEILNRYSIPPEKVIVASNAADERFFAEQPLADAELVTLRTRRPFLLYIGAIEPRKNVGALVDALARLPDELQLVIAGNDGWDSGNIWRQIAQSPSSGRIVRAGFVSDETLPTLIASATAVVYPSHYEGFGLPVVEALAAGVPVAVSDLPVFHEVGGQEVEYFDPTDSADIAHAIERAISSDRQSGARRERRSAWARRFDWQSSANVVAARLLDGA